MPAQIQDTPVLKGKDAENVIEEMKKGPTEKSKKGEKILLEKYKKKEGK